MSEVKDQSRYLEDFSSSSANKQTIMQGQTDLTKSSKNVFCSQAFLNDVRRRSSSFLTFIFYVYLLFLCACDQHRLKCVSRDEKCLFIQFSEGKCQINAKSISLSLSLAASCSIQQCCITPPCTYIIIFVKYCDCYDLNVKLS